MNRYTYSNPIDNVMKLTLSRTAITDYYLKNVKSLILKTESDDNGKPDKYNLEETLLNKIINLSHIKHLRIPYGSVPFH
jgi:hypothetical protein